MDNFYETSRFQKDTSVKQRWTRRTRVSGCLSPVRDSKSIHLRVVTPVTGNPNTQNSMSSLSPYKPIPCLKPWFMWTQLRPETVKDRPTRTRSVSWKDFPECKSGSILSGDGTQGSKSPDMTPGTGCTETGIVPPQV